MANSSVDPCTLPPITAEDSSSFPIPIDSLLRGMTIDADIDTDSTDVGKGHMVPRAIRRVEPLNKMSCDSSAIKQVELPPPVCDNLPPTLRRAGMNPSTLPYGQLGFVKSCKTCNNSLGEIGRSYEVASAIPWINNNNNNNNTYWTRESWARYNRWIRMKTLRSKRRSTRGISKKNARLYIHS